MFEYAARNKLRFPYKGMITAEDLWDLNVRELDSIFKTLNAQVKKAQEESLLETKNKEDEVLSVQIDIVRHIVRIKQDEEAERLFAKERKEKRQKLMELISAKQDEDLHSKSIDELKAMLAELE